ncbi:MAG: hypothetical protein WBD36_10770 [Bacteroidota bacterium]
MSTGQTMLVLGAFTLLSMLTLTMNRTIFGSVNLGFEMETNLNGISIAQSLMDEILTQDFDERTTTGVKIYSASDMTAAASFGPDLSSSPEIAITWEDSAYTDGSGVFHDYESKAKWDDVDDYHRYRRRVWDKRLGWFHDSVYVQYVNEDSPDSVVTSPVQHKRVTVVVTHPNLPKNESGTVYPVVLRDLSVYRRFFQ